jgi:hypothetical protein
VPTELESKGKTLADRTDRVALDDDQVQGEVSTHYNCVNSSIH